MHNRHSPYTLLTPGPLSTTRAVKEAMLRDWCTWDREYNDLVQLIRGKLTALATKWTASYTTVLMQGSGTFAVEAAIGTALSRADKLLVLVNGAYGQRMARIAATLGIACLTLDSGELEAPDPAVLEETLLRDKAITHVGLVHCETTTGMLNPLEPLCAVARKYGKRLIVDAISSFGGIEFDAGELQIDYLIGSANKCLQGVPGFAFVVAERAALERCGGQARSLALDLYGQWRTMEEERGKWRFTSPTHAVHAFYHALLELEREGGVKARHARYAGNQRLLSAGMARLGFRPLLPEPLQSPIVTAFRYPDAPAFSFAAFYGALKGEGFVLYPGKLTEIDTFRIGNIGDVYPDDLLQLLAAVERKRFW